MQIKFVARQTTVSERCSNSGNSLSHIVSCTVMAKHVNVCHITMITVFNPLCASRSFDCRHPRHPKKNMGLQVPVV